MPEIDPKTGKKIMGAAVTKMADQFVILQRVKEVREMVQDGRPSVSIAQEKSVEWGLSERQVYNYIQKVMHEMKEADAKYVAMRASQRRAQLERLYEKCLAQEDLKTAAGILAQLCKLDGVNAPEAVQHDVKHSVAVLSPDEKQARLQELMAERQNYLEATFTETGEDADEKEKEDVA